MVYSRKERVLILEHYLASKSFAAVREALTNVYPDKKVLNETSTLTGNRISGHRKYLSVTSAHRTTKQLKLRPYRFQAVHHLQLRDTAAKIQYCHWFRRFVREGVYV
jgi:hypothetical protein